MKELRINYKTIRLGSFIFLALPVLLFFLFFVKWYISLMAIITILIVLQKIISQREEKRELIFSRTNIFFYFCHFMNMVLFGRPRRPFFPN